MAVRLTGVLPADAARMAIITLRAEAGFTVTSIPDVYANRALTRKVLPLFRPSVDGSHVGAIDSQGAFECWAPDPGDGQAWVAITCGPDGTERHLRLTPVPWPEDFVRPQWT